MYAIIRNVSKDKEGKGKEMDEENKEGKQKRLRRFVWKKKI